MESQIGPPSCSLILETTDRLGANEPANSDERMRDGKVQQDPYDVQPTGNRTSFFMACFRVVQHDITKRTAFFPFCNLISRLKPTISQYV